MKIAEVTVYPAKAQKHVKTSGVAAYVKNLFGNEPHRSQDEVYVVCEKLDGITEAYDEDGLHVARSFNRNATFAWPVYKQLQRIRPDVVHFQQEMALYGSVYTMYMLQLLLLVLRLKKVPTVVTLHHVVDIKKVDTQFVRANSSSAPAWAVKCAFVTIYRPLTKWASAIIVHEHCFKDLLVTQYGVPAAKIYVVPHGVEDLQALPVTAARKQLHLRQKQHVVLSMGYLAGYKDYNLLIEGFALYAATDPDAYLIIGAGRHPKLENDAAYLKIYTDTQAKAHTLISKNQHRWVGFIPEADIATYYSASDVSMYPYKISMSSSGPMAIAMGYERPFLGSDVYAAVLPANVLFERTPVALAAKLHDFFANQGNYQQLSRTMKRERLWRTVGKQTMDVYKEVCHVTQ
jgi:glycosyltransferase involved in cell wall biosynthesis